VVTEKMRTMLEHFSFDAQWTATPAANENRKFPRSSQYLLAHVEIADLVLDGVTADFSMSGACLRLPVELPCPLNSSIAIQLRIPYDNIQQYESQLPLELMCSIVWHKRVDGEHHYGVKFNEFMPPETAQSLKACFAFFNHSATY